MASVLLDEGAADIFTQMAGGGGPGPAISLRLFTSPATPIEGDTIFAFVPPSGGGYADHDFAFGDWGAGAPVGQVTTWTTGDVVFSVPTTGPNILGGVYYDRGNTKALLAVLFTTPVDPTTTGGVLKVSPSFSVGPGT